MHLAVLQSFVELIALQSVDQGGKLTSRTLTSSDIVFGVKFPIYTMEIEDNVVDEVWKGALPLRVSLAKLDIASNEVPADFYCMAARISYVPGIIEAVKKHFDLYVSTDYRQEEIWFSFNNVPLKWHYPVGLLFDLHNPPKDSLPLLPFHLEVHFHRFPSEVLLPYSGIKSIRSIFQNALKESSALLFGTSGPVMNLSRDQEESMWKSLSDLNFKSFKEIGSEFMRPDIKTCRYVPVKFLQIRDKVQTLHPILANDNLSIDSAAHLLFPSFAGTYLVQGIQVPGESDLFWLWLHLSFPDNFLYVVLLD